MKIGIDARFVGPEGTVLGKYTEKLIENLVNIDHENEYIAFVCHDNWDFLDFSGVKNFRKVLANVRWYSLNEQLKIPAIFKREKLDLLHVPHFNVPIFYKGKFIVTIHDLIHHNFSESASTTRNPLIFRAKRLAYRKIIKSAILKSAHIITPSNYVKEEIVKTFNVDPQKITVTYEAAEEEYFNSKTQDTSYKMLEKFSIKKPFLIYVGNAYPHKNIDRLLGAFKILKAQFPNLNLVIVCARDVFWQRLENSIEKLDLQKNVITTGYIESKDLPVIFKNAKAYVFPTLSEGFGIPGLNAMASSLPVVASNIPVLKEVYGDAALYFNPKDPRDIAQQIKKILLSQKTRFDLVKKGSDRAKNYSWQKMAKETLTVYENIT